MCSSILVNGSTCQVQDPVVISLSILMVYDTNTLTILTAYLSCIQSYNQNLEVESSHSRALYLGDGVELISGR